MAPNPDKISIEIYSSLATPETARGGADSTGQAIRMLARLIGRQIAREQFERKIALERRARKKGQASRSV
jgi:hypothetical protein